jgi:DNA-binding CsgD family transcriptional regulator
MTRRPSLLAARAVRVHPRPPVSPLFALPDPFVVALANHRNAVIARDALGPFGAVYNLVPATDPVPIVRGAVVVDLVPSALLPRGFLANALTSARTTPVLLIAPALPVEVIVPPVPPDVFVSVAHPALTAARLRRFAVAALAFAHFGDAAVADAIGAMAADYALSPRESMLLVAAVAGASRRAILDAAAVTLNTLKTQIRSLLVKAGARTLDELALRVLRTALVLTSS